MLYEKYFGDEANFKVGYKQSIKALSEEDVKLVVIARDADDYVKRKPIEIARTKNIDVEYIESKKKLGKICKIDVGAAIAVVID